MHFLPLVIAIQLLTPQIVSVEHRLNKISSAELLKNIKSHVVKLPDGVSVRSGKENSIVFSGDKRSVDTAVEAVTKADRAPDAYVLRFELLDGEELISRPTLRSVAGLEAKFSISFRGSEASVLVIPRSGLVDVTIGSEEEFVVLTARKGMAEFTLSRKGGDGKQVIGIPEGLKLYDGLTVRISYELLKPE